MTASALRWVIAIGCLAGIALLHVVAPSATVPPPVLKLSPYQQKQDPPVCPDREEFWKCGVIEMACSRTGEPAGDDDTEIWHACECRHACEKGQKKFSDRRCTARCSRDHCHCPSLCDET